MIAIVHGTTWFRQGQGPVDSGLAAWMPSTAQRLRGVGWCWLLSVCLDVDD